jgi:hypothetical protein
MQHARGEMRNAYSILVGKPHWEKTFRRHVYGMEKQWVYRWTGFE